MVLLFRLELPTRECVGAWTGGMRAQAGHLARARSQRQRRTLRVDRSSTHGSMDRYPTDGTLVWFGGIGRRGGPGRGYGGRVDLSFTELLNAGDARCVVGGAVRLGGKGPHRRPEGASVSDRNPHGPRPPAGLVGPGQ